MRSSLSGRATLARLTHVGLMLGVVLLLAVASLVVLQVVARNFLNLGLPWADELARFSGIGLVFLTVPCLAGRQVLVSVSVLPDAFSARWRRYFVLLADIATLAFAGLLLWSFAAFLPRAGKFLTPALGLPNTVYYSLALLGSVLLAMVAIARVLATLQGQDPTVSHRRDDDTADPTP